MKLAHSLAHTADVFEPKTFSALREQMDPEWITQALEATATVTVRRRRLPAEEMIWLVIGMALLRDRTIVDVARSLSIGDGPPVSDSAAVQARARLGKEPLQWLFDASAKVWAHRSAAAERFHGLACSGVDGTSIRVPDSPDNAACFGYSKSARGESAYPLVRLCALMALRSHLLAAVAFGQYSTGELSYAESLWPQVPDNSVCVIDRGFFSARLLLGLQSTGENRHWLIRVKARTQMHVVERTDDGDALVELPVSPEARQRDPSLPLTFRARLIDYQRPGFAPQKLLTSLTDARRFAKDEIAALYHERWELELGYDEIKTDMLDRRECIRSKSPDGVEQELWGLLIAYNLVRVYMERVASLAKLPPLRISFIAALRSIREEWYWDSIPGFSPGSLPRHMDRLAQQLCRFVLPERRSTRSHPRAVKIKMSNYPRKRRPPTVP